MKNKIYLDINIVADMIDASRFGHEKSLEALKKSILNDLNLFVSEDILTTANSPH